MPLALGTATPSSFKVGTADCSALYLGSNLLWTGVAAPTTQTLYNDTFTGTTGAAPAAAWTKATTFPTTGLVTIQSNAMRLNTNSTAQWVGNASIFLGDPNMPQGNAATGAPAIVSNAEYTFDYTLGDLGDQYPCIAFRARSAELWQDGDGGGQFKTGYQLVLGVVSGTIELVQGYNAGLADPIASFTFAFTNVATKWRIKLDHNMLYVRVWLASASEPATWNLSGPYIGDESDGSIGFAAGNASANAAKTVTIDNFVSTTPILALGTSRTTPPADPAGFTRILTESFDTTAAAGTSSGQFMNVYANSFQPYTDGGTVGAGAMYPSQMISAHDGVMDVYSDGLKASAGSWGSAANAYDRIGGRFSIRMKALGMFGNGPAFMLWPSDTDKGTWAFGEIDFPESTSGRGGYEGFQNAPYIHHHKMVVGQEKDAQDVPLGVSWREWHVYTVEWFPPGKGLTPATGNVRYYVDGVEVFNSTIDIPTTVHRWCFQIGDWGTPGNIYIDWVAMSSLT